MFFEYVWVHGEAQSCVSRPLSIGLIQLVSELENYAQKQAQSAQGFIPCDEVWLHFFIFFLKKVVSNSSLNKNPKQVLNALNAARFFKQTFKTISSLSGSQQTETPR